MKDALGTALFHFLWQGAALALIPALALMFRSPRVRYAAACVALFAMPVAFAVTFALSLPAAGSRMVIPVHLPRAVPLPPSAGTPSLPFDFERSMRWFVPFWIAGVALFYLRTFAAWIALRKLRSASVAPAPAFWKQRLEELAARLGIRRAVALFGSDLVDVPVVAGFLKPAVFVPMSLFTGLPAEQLEYLLIHELAHIRRFDYAVNLLQKAVEGLLFYHPAVWWVSRILRTERENCCDDTVVEMRGNACEYASVLASLEQSRNSPALAAGGGNLAKRILRLLNRPTDSSAAPAFGLLALALFATAAWAALQQPAPPPVRLIAQARPESAPLPTPYEKWLSEDVAYIVTKEEREAFQRLTTDAEREHFIEQFWQRRDPTPGTPENEFKEEYYRRVAFANDHFRSSVPGWKTDRGRVYIVYGPPDEIDMHPSGDDPTWLPYAYWLYRYIEGIGTNVGMRFTDTARDGAYKLDDAKAATAPPVVVKREPNGVTIVVSLDPTKNTNVFLRITTSDRRPVTTMEKPSLRQAFAGTAG
jgi:GWxTD domain-containing protein